MPGQKAEAEASWSALDNNGGRWATGFARSPIGDEFPVRIQGEEEESFRVRVIDGTDDAVVVLILPPKGEQIENWAQVEHRVVRDRPLRITIDGREFSLQYSSNYVRRSDNAVTDLVPFVITSRPLEDFETD